LLYNSLRFLAAEQNPLWNKTWKYILLGKKENKTAEKEGLLYASLPTLPTSHLPITRKIET